MQTAVEYIKPMQIKIIHILKNRLGWSDAEYREYLMIHGDGFATSCKDLSAIEAARLIRRMELAAAAKGVWQRHGASAKYSELGERPGMASPKQLRKIEAMWRDVSKQHATDKRAMSLRRILFRIAKVDDLRFLSNAGASKVINALEEMKLRRW